MLVSEEVVSKASSGYLINVERNLKKKEGKQKRKEKKDGVQALFRECEEVKANFQVEQKVVTLVSLVTGIQVVYPTYPGSIFRRYKRFLLFFLGNVLITSRLHLIVIGALSSWTEWLGRAPMYSPLSSVEFNEWNCTFNHYMPY
jgi:hypothetical protein